MKMNNPLHPLRRVPSTHTHTHEKKKGLIFRQKKQLGEQQDKWDQTGPRDW